MLEPRYDIEYKISKEITQILENSNKDLIEEENQILTCNDFLSSYSSMNIVVQNGIPFSLFDLIKQETPFNEIEWADILDISLKSLKRYETTADYHFRISQSEKIIELFEVVHTGKEVFGSKEKFNIWLHTPNFSLGKERPIDLLKNSYGKELVMGELVRINHGILA